ncbi:MAG: hypothetical protein GF400_05840 [Candidatus Eisenbacteria bacterium]|nr:hypothetical protein [Candidatus Eisenbacteria bacterium]
MNAKLLVSLTVMLTVLLVAPTGLQASPPEIEEAARDRRVPGRARDDGRSPTILFFDDMEGGENGWQHVDHTAQQGTRFHIDTYQAFEGGHSWWCGEFNASFAGGDGYGNDWVQMLELPEVDISGAVYPIIEFAYRCDTEEYCDLVYVQAESGGVYVDLNEGWGGVEPWNSFSGYAVGPSTYDDPLKVRFRFESDAAFSDEDGGYDSDGGAFHVDDIRVYDYSSGTTIFLDDCEGGGLCTPSIPTPVGDYWHLTSRECAAYSGTQCWWCGDDADTSMVPGNVINSLTSPEIDISGSLVCTLRFLIHAQVPTDDADFWKEEVSTDGGENWYTAGIWWGDFGGCNTWASHGISGVDVGPYLPGSTLMFRITMHTTSDGCGPGAAGGAGVMLDDVWVEDWTGSAVERTTWGRIKAMYRT